MQSDFDKFNTFWTHVQKQYRSGADQFLEEWIPLTAENARITIELINNLVLENVDARVTLKIRKAPPYQAIAILADNPPWSFLLQLDETQSHVKVNECVSNEQLKAICDVILQNHTVLRNLTSPPEPPT